MTGGDRCGIRHRDASQARCALVVSQTPTLRTFAFDHRVEVEPIDQHPEASEGLEAEVGAPVSNLHGGGDLTDFVPEIFPCLIEFGNAALDPRGAQHGKR